MVTLQWSRISLWSDSFPEHLSSSIVARSTHYFLHCLTHLKAASFCCCCCCWFCLQNYLQHKYSIKWRQWWSWYSRLSQKVPQTNSMRYKGVVERASISMRLMKWKRVTYTLTINFLGYKNARREEAQTANHFVSNVHSFRCNWQVAREGISVNSRSSW